MVPILFVGACMCAMAQHPDRSRPSTNDHSYAAASTAGCGFEDNETLRAHGDIAELGRRAVVDALLFRMQSEAMERKGRGMRPLAAETIYTIPVVVHIIHNGGIENISDPQVQHAIELLNQAFANTDDYDSTTGASVPIRFCLAHQDERGKYTSGITRTRSPLTNMTIETQSTALKALVLWDPAHYLNIWVVNTINSISPEHSITGNATGPGRHGQFDDGIVMEADIFGASVDGTKILVHEAGHYLGLYHTFAGGCRNSDCLLDGDHVCDTPPDNTSAVSPCGVSVNSCTTDADDQSAANPFRPTWLGGLGDRPDMTSNYMDYGMQQCIDDFTAGQRDRMVAVLVGVRSSLLASSGCEDPCASSIAIGIAMSDSVVVSGSTLQLTNRTTGATRYEWFVDGVFAAQTPNYAFMRTQKGTYVVTLRAYNGDTTCMRERTVRITVRCLFTVACTADRTSIQPGEFVTFTSTNAGATTYTYYVDGVPELPGPTLTKQFLHPGGYRVYLVATDGTCSDTSAAVLISVGDCHEDRSNRLWYFGNRVGLDFRESPPALVFNGQMNAREGCATMSDHNGSLLFYSDGENVWNRQHAIMKNGSGLGGSQWAAQSCLIVQAPLSDSLYYIFTNSDWVTPGRGLSYSTVDITADNGLGAVIARGVVLDTSASEWMAGTYHANCVDVWIVSHERWSSRFVAYQLTPEGVTATPVLTTIAPEITGDNRYGCIQFNGDGTQFAMACGGVKTGPTLLLGSFNRVTGTVTSVDTLASAGLMEGAYSAEFSPNNKLIYATGINLTRVYQYDLSLPTMDAVRASRVTLGGPGETRPYVQAGPDGRLYIAKTKTKALDVIELPNVAGIGCSYTINGVFLLDRSATMGFCNSVRGYQMRPATLSGIKEQCSNGRGVLYQANGGWCSHGTNHWRVTGPAVIAWARGKQVALDFTGSGLVMLYLENRGPCGSLMDSAIITVNNAPAVHLGNDTIACAGSGITLDAGGGWANYVWQNGATGRTFHVTTSGTYFVEATNGVCTGRDTIDVVVAAPSPSLDLGPDRAICSGTALTLDAGAGCVSYRWQDGYSEQVYTANSPGLYWVEAVSACGAVLRDTVRLFPQKSQLVDLGPDIQLCNGAVAKLTGGPPALYYRWSTGAGTPSIDVDTAGTFWVLASDGSCEWTDTVVVTMGGGSIHMSAALPDVRDVPPGTEVLVPLVTQSYSDCFLPARAYAFHARLRYAKRLLESVPPTPADVLDGDERVLDLDGVTTGNDTAAIVHLRTMLGDASTAVITIDSIGIEAIVSDSIHTRNGTVTILVCRSGGGARLLDASLDSKLTATSYLGRLEIQCRLQENGASRLELVDLLGRGVATLFDGDHAAGTITQTLDINGLASGFYLLVLRTPSEVLSRQVVVVR